MKLLSLSLFLFLVISHPEPPAIQTSVPPNPLNSLSGSTSPNTHAPQVHVPVGLGREMTEPNQVSVRGIWNSMMKKKRRFGEGRGGEEVQSGMSQAGRQAG